MDEQTFWDLVDRIGHDPADFDRLADELSDHGAADILDFADHLARALHALDTPAHYRAAATSSMSFLGVRCAVVAAGATAYRKVSERARRARLLCRPARRPVAAGRRARLPHLHPRRLAAPAGGQHPHRLQRRSLGRLLAAPAHGHHHHRRRPRAAGLHDRAAARGADARRRPDWRSWWRQSGLRACELGIVAEGKLDHLRPSADIRRFDDRLKANFTCALPPAPARHRPGGPGGGRGAGDVRGDPRRRCRCRRCRPPRRCPPCRPTCPRCRSPPRPLPAGPQELEPQGYLTLTQIQEFFG